MNEKPTNIVRPNPVFETRLATNDDDLRAAQRLRYAVFVDELGGDGPFVDHAMHLERDHFDAYAAHFLLLDHARAASDRVVGVYRVLTQDRAAAAGGFYCADEYDLTLLQNNGGRLMELGRSCLHPDYRGGSGMMHLWGALAEHVAAHRVDTLFGVASFHGTDTQALAQPLSLLHQRHLAPAGVRVAAQGPTARSLELLDKDSIDRVAAVRQMPALLKAYLRLGATVGDGAFVDHAFNTTDVCVILQTDAINALQRAILGKGARHG